MPIYTVLAPRPPADSVEVDPVDYVFVKDGFCWPCLVIAEIWMIFRRLWRVLLIYLIAVVVVLAIRQVIGGPLPIVFLVLAHFYFALEANALRVWTLRRRGYRLVGVAAGRRVGEAEIRFFHELEFPRRDLRQPPPDRLRSAAGGGPIRGPSAESGEVVGLFPAPGGSS
jgi:hypothetical protein